ncbi:MAG: type IV toxin-antitoxin system AbiEi family antitoxin [Pseudomonadota bacterium]
METRTASIVPYLGLLEGLPFIRKAMIGPDNMLLLKTPKAQYQLRIEHREGQIDHTLVNALIARARGKPRQTIVLASYIPAPLANLLANAGLCYLDAVGNCRVALGDEYLALIEGRKAPRLPIGRRTLRAAGYQVLFALLARPEIVSRPVREIAAAAGTGKSAAADLLSLLAEEAKLTELRHGRRLLPDANLRERWLRGYVDVLRPRWLAGRYRPREESPEALDRIIETELAGVSWAFGGTAAAMRLTQHYRGVETVLHFAEPPPADVGARLHALPAPQGPLTILHTPCPAAFEGVKPHTVHPLLVYAELLASQDERAIEMAAEVLERFTASADASP